MNHQNSGRESVGVGIIGAGNIARFHARALQEGKNTHLVGIYSDIPDLTRSVAGDVGCAAFDDRDRFLADPYKPMILALQRPDERKNLPTLVTAFANHRELREMANLVLMIGSRDDISDLPKGQRRVLSDMLLEIDRHDLYGSVAYPKSHVAEDVPPLYRLAAGRRPIPRPRPGYRYREGGGGAGARPRQGPLRRGVGGHLRRQAASLHR